MTLVAVPKLLISGVDIPSGTDKQMVGCNPYPWSTLANALIPNDYFGRALDPFWFSCRTKAREMIAGAVMLWIASAGLTLYRRKPKEEHAPNNELAPA